MTDRAAGRQAAKGQAGFTLIEMLVALAIFAMLAGGALTLLRFAVDAEQASRIRTRDMAATRRFLAIWTADLTQAVARPSRDAAGLPQVAFASDGAVLLRLTRGGRADPDGAPRPALEKLEYRWTGQVLARAGYPYPDGAQADAATPVLALAGPPRLRFRAADGRWLAQWRPSRPDDLPVAVEALLPLRRGGPPLRVVTPVGFAAAAPR